MKIDTNNSAIKDLYMQKLSKNDVKKIKQEIADSRNRYTFTDFSKNYGDKKLPIGMQIQQNSEDFQRFLYSNGIDGVSVKRVSQLTFVKPSYLDVKI
jgi:hypothetical protein